MNKVISPNWSLLIAGLVGLTAVYILKDHLNLWAWFHGEHSEFRTTIENIRSFPPEVVITNKVFRFILNDIFSIAVIHAVFRNRTYTRFAIGVLFFGLLVLLPAYFSMVYYMPAGYSSTVASMHRIILNPVLMMLLIPFFYLREKEKKKGG